MPKKWYESKTIWLNGIAFICTLIQTKTGYVVDPAVQGALLTVANLILRAITHEEIVWS